MTIIYEGPLYRLESWDNGTYYLIIRRGDGASVFLSPEDLSSLDWEGVCEKYAVLMPGHSGAP